MNITVISGGQTGADQAALRAAKACGLPTGGWAPKGWRTEDGPAPWLAEYGLRECPHPGYPARTTANVLEAGALLWFGDPESPGGKLTLRTAGHKPTGIFPPEWLAAGPDPGRLASTIRAILPHGGSLLIAGNRESSAPGIGLQVETILAEAFRLLAEAEGAKP